MFGLKPREQRAIDPSSWGQAWGDPYTAETWAGSRVTNSTAIQMLTVYGCVKFIADGISTLPIDEFRFLPDGTKKEISPKTGWLEQPTPDLDRTAWCTQVLTSLLLAGNAYLHVQRVSVSDAVVTPLDPQKVSVFRENGRKQYRINGVSAGNAEIHHIPGLMLPGSDVGMSPVEMARQTLGAGMAAEEYAARFFGQGATTSGVIENPKDMPPDGPGSARELARQFARLHSGKNKAHLPAVLVGGATWKATGVTNEQAQFLETRQFTAAQIASMMFMIDPTEFGMSPSGSSITYANLEQRNSRKVTVTFLPWIIRIERTMSNILAGSRHVKFNVSGLLRGDLKTRYESYEIASRINTASAGQPVFLSTDEMREFEDLGPTTVMSTPPAAASPVALNLNMAQQPVVQPPTPNVTVERSDTYVTVEAATQEFHWEPRVEVLPPNVDVHVAPVEVNVTTPEIRVDSPVTVNVPEQPAPNVTIEQPTKRSTSKTVIRNKDGQIARIIEE